MPALRRLMDGIAYDDMREKNNSSSSAAYGRGLDLFSDNPFTSRVFGVLFVILKNSAVINHYLLALYQNFSIFLSPAVHNKSIFPFTARILQALRYIRFRFAIS